MERLRKEEEQRQAVLAKAREIEEARRLEEEAKRKAEEEARRKVNYFLLFPVPWWILISKM